MQRDAAVKQPDLEPIPSDQLSIARLARERGQPAEEARVLALHTPHIRVQLHRANLELSDAGDYFTLKLLLARALRRSMRNAVIEVDDAEQEAPAGTLFEISLVPDDVLAYKRAAKIARRVLRGNHRRPS
ncbi:MAG: hypothetical protein ACNA8J_04510 [Gammaproteobacteria bacterium]